MDLQSNPEELQSPEEYIPELSRDTTEEMPLIPTLRQLYLRRQINSEFQRQDEIRSESRMNAREQLMEDFLIFNGTNDVFRHFIMTEIEETILNAALQESLLHDPVPLHPVSDLVLNELPITELDEDKLIKYHKCSICLEDFTLKEKVINLACNHFYHEKCIKEWFKKQNTCPLCQQLVVTSN